MVGLELVSLLLQHPGNREVSQKKKADLDSSVDIVEGRRRASHNDD